jgi:site-specific DNA recombinase
MSRSQDLAPLVSRQHYRGVRIIGVQDGFDSTSRTARMQAGMSGIMSEEFRAQIADRTRSSMVMHAQLGASTGGRAYGYRDDETVIVREIFDRFASGDTLKQIANELNRRKVPSPGAQWKRDKRATHGRWLVSALHAIIRNERYVGRLIYNRSAWHKDPESGIRKRVERPQSEWVVRECAALVDEATWRASQLRIGARTQPGGVRKYLLSGLLVCGQCGSKMVVMGGSQRRYVCGTHHGGGEHACSNGASVPRSILEERILQPVMEDLLSPESIDRAMRTMRAESRHHDSHEIDPQIAELERLVRDGLLSAEIAAPALAEARRRAAPTPAVVMPTKRIWADAVARMREMLTGDDVATARELLAEIIGEVIIRPDGPDHVMARIMGRQVMIGTGTGIWLGSGGRI